MLIARATNTQAITVLNHAGVCASYTGAWKYLLKLCDESQYLSKVREGHWLWAYDNLNIHQGIHHEREDCHSSMLNVTTRLAIRIRNLPEFAFDWSDNKPQRDVSSLTIDDFVPSIVESQELKDRATQFVMEFMLEHFPSLSDLKRYVTSPALSNSVTSSEVAPMKLLFKDENYKSETIDILDQLVKDGNLSGSNQVLIGDQLTCKIIRGCIPWRQVEYNPVHRFHWANAVPGDFHFLWENLKVIWLVFWGSPALPGSICNLREHVSRTRVDKSAKVFNTNDEFCIHLFKAHLLARICTLLKIGSPNEHIEHECDERWLRAKVEKIVSESFCQPASEDPVYNLHGSLLQLGFRYIDLRNAIRNENGPAVVLHWKLWLPWFLATNRKNYATESVHLLANLSARFPKHIAYIATHNRTVNMSGRNGRGKPVDQMVEHYNLAIKQALQAGGGHNTEKHIEDVSLCALFLMEAARKTDEAFGCSRSSSHTVRDADGDIKKMMEYLLEMEVTTEDSSRECPEFINPVDKGFNKLYTTSWVKDVISKGVLDDDSSEVTTVGEIDQNYEIADVI